MNKKEQCQCGGCFPDGYRILRIFSILFLPERFAYRKSFFCIEGIPIGYYMIFFALLF